MFPINLMSIFTLFVFALIGVAVTTDSLAADNCAPVCFSTINQYAVDTSDLDRVDDVRTFTAEALFSESSLRLNRPLTEDELSAIARTSNQFESFNNIRIVPSVGWPAIDLFYKYKSRDDLQITNFFEPDQFNDVRLNEYGLALQKWLRFDHGDWFLRGSYKRSHLKGTIEFWPDEDEEIDTFELNGAFLSHPFSEDRFAASATFVTQDIDQTIPEALRFPRDRKIGAGLFSWGDFGSDQNHEIKPLSAPESVLRSPDPRPAASIENIFARRFDPRGRKLYGGFVYDVETFGDTDVTRKDFFIGTALPWDAKNTPLQVAVQGTIFTYDVDTDSTQNNSQYRTNITAFYQPSKDWELVVPFRHDLALDGPNDFENWRLGIGARRGWRIGDANHRRLDLSAECAVQNFYKIDKVLSIFRLNLSLVL